MNARKNHHASFVCPVVAMLGLFPAFAADVTDAALVPVEIKRPAPRYRDPSFIRYQTGPSIAVAPGGRIWVAIMTGGTTECNENYVDLITSGDGGATWSEPKMALDIDGPMRTFDPAMWTDPEGRVWLFWCQVYDFWDGRGGLWASVCERSDDGRAGCRPEPRVPFLLRSAPFGQHPLREKRSRRNADGPSRHHGFPVGGRRKDLSLQAGT